MNNIFCIATCSNVGGTFLDWSIHYLSGQTLHYNYALTDWTQLSLNPLTEINAHGHAKNHPLGTEVMLKMLMHFEDLKTTDLLSMYSMPMGLTQAMENIGICSTNLNEETYREKLFNHILLDFYKLLEKCEESNIKLLYIHVDESAISQTWNSRVPDDECKNIPWNTSDDPEIPLWDLREIKALDIRPFKSHCLKVNPEISGSHLWINCVDLWTNTDDILIKCLKYLNLKLDHSRFESWKPIAASWQKKLNQGLMFGRELNHIVDYTIKGLPYDISHLTFDQEVIVQHMLIYKHNLNIKNWKLEKFPNNTKELHLLLEKNNHPTELLY